MNICARVAVLGIASAVTAITVSLEARAPAAEPQVQRAGGNIRATNTPDGPAPRLPDGKPDMSGVWLGGAGYGNVAGVLAKGETIELLPEARKIMAARRANEDPGTNCLPITVPRGSPYPWRLVITPTHALFVYEYFQTYRQVFMDGRQHPAPADINPTWHGHSIGRWDGDTLVIDTIGYNDKGWFDSRGHPQTEKLHTIERFTRTNLGTMAIEVTIDDPGSYAKPFKLSFAARLMPGAELLEFICQENNQDVPHIEGPADTRRGGVN